MPYSKGGIRKTSGNGYFLDAWDLPLSTRQQEQSREGAVRYYLKKSGGREVYKSYASLCLGVTTMWNFDIEALSPLVSGFTSPLFTRVPYQTEV